MDMFDWWNKIRREPDIAPIAHESKDRIGLFLQISKDLTDEEIDNILYYLICMKQAGYTEWCVYCLTIMLRDDKERVSRSTRFIPMAAGEIGHMAMTSLGHKGD